MPHNSNKCVAAGSRAGRRAGRRFGGVTRRKMMAKGIGRNLVAALGGLAIASVVGCSSPPPPPPPPTVAVVNIQAGGDINPDPQGAAAPVSVRIYQLSQPAKFQTADFFQLYRGDSTTLGPTMLGRDEVVVLPGKTQVVTEMMKPDATSLGILVAFRDIDHAVWRVVAPVPPNKTTTFALTLSGLQATLSTASK